ncbi:predicted protein [Naegleria gruberi]|uniref:Predicted protein n=1 Tax=Naegleria gruberi TaxID=5762 RepID=D2UZS7_NAEGR|nr:uncharacterized protein NAEGRDRAFT_62046 [Naegleria gruberi]EFC49986.1 predicted protein [Naegleria gruberi]|eukprot:XP_002682730.1 predicted protein [Naegleria gruberi strain NEG-M]
MSDHLSSHHAAGSQTSPSSSIFESFYRKFESLRRSNVLTELRDILESASLSECFEFSSILLRPLVEFLNEGTTPKFKKDDKEHLLRQVIIEIIQKLPHTELFDERAGKKDDLVLLVNSLINVIKTDNEINGVVAIRLIIEIQKCFKSNITDFVQPLIEIFLHFFGNFEKIVEKYLGRKPKKNASDPTVEGESYPLTELDLIPSMDSCKLMLELPVFIIFFFRTLTIKDTNNNIFIKLVEKMYDILRYEVSVSDSVMSSPFGKERVEDFMLLRVKTISFLIYTSSKYKNNDNYTTEIPRFVIKCLRECPDECIAPRKEMLSLMRHIVERQNDDSNTICKYFLPYMNEMLDDTILIGKSRSAQETVRSSAYSTVLEILKNQLKNIEFSPSNIASCILFCTKVLFDSSLGITIHGLATGLLVALTQNVFDQIRKISGVSDPSGDVCAALSGISEESLSQITKFKDHLLSIIQTFVQKIKFISNFIKKIIQYKNIQKSSTLNEKEQTDDMTMILPFSPYKSCENFNDDISYCSMMFKQIIFGLKSTVLLYNMIPRNEKQKFPELSVLSKLFRYGLDCFDIFNLYSEDTEYGQKQRVLDEKEIFNNYSSLYTSLPSALFTEIFKTQFDYLYKKLLEGRTMTFIHIPSNILSSSQHIASILSEILLKFLLKRMDRIPKDRKEAYYIHNLYKLVFGSVVTFPKNESILKNQMTSIVTSCFSYASKYKDCLDYYLILRSLFSSILTAKFDLLCKEFSQLLPTVLEKLSDLVNNAHDKETRNIFVELCLTVPSKLHVLCPYLYLLIKPILYALEPGSSEKAVSAALRNLDLWVTSLRNESLEAILKPVIPDLLKALFSHLKPPPYPHGSAVMKLLAKLGGSHRQYMSELTSVSVKSPNALFLNINFNSNQTESLPMDELVDTSIEICFDKDQDVQTKKSAFDFLKTSLLTMMSCTEQSLAIPNDFKFSFKHINPKKYFHISASSPKSCDPFQNILDVLEPKGSMLYESEIAIFTKILKNIFLFMNYAVKENLVECIEFTKSLIKHFAILSIFVNINVEQASKFRINPDWFYEVLMSVFEEDCTETSPSVNVGDFILYIFTDYVYELCDNDADMVIQFGIWERLQSRFTKYLYQPEWYKKCVGAKGIIFLSENITPAWLVHYEADIVRALFFSLKNQPPHMLSHTNQITIMAAESIIKACYNTAIFDITHLCNGQINEKIVKVDNAPDSLTEGEVVVHVEKVGRESIFRKRLILHLLYTELTSTQSHIRRLAQSLLRLCSELMNIPVLVILERFRQELPIKDEKQAKDLSQITVMLELLVFQLATRDSNLTGSTISVAFNKALTLLRNDDYGKETKDQKKIFNAKIVALKLIREAVVSKELRYNEKDQLKTMIETFCKFLNAQNKEVVTIAKTALISFISQFKTPKDSLQHSLRQISTNFQKHAHFTLLFLQGASFFLKFNSNMQGLKFGPNLLDNLKKWLDKSSIKHIQNVKEKPLVAAEMISLFSITDSAEFLPQIVPMVLQLEAVWSDEIKSSNPFIAPLAKYLNIYYEDAIKYFFDPTSGCFVLSSKRNYQFFMDILKCRKSIELTAHLLSQSNIISNLLSNITKLDFYSDNFASDPNNVLTLVGSITKLSPGWFTKKKPVFDEILRLWLMNIKFANSLHNSNQSNLEISPLLDVQIIRFTRKLIKFIINYCDCNSNEVISLFEIVKVFGCGLVMDLTFVKDYFRTKVGLEYSTERKEEILQNFCALFKRDEISFHLKSDALKHIVIPIVNGAAKSGTVFNVKIMGMLFEEILQTLPQSLAKLTDKEKYSLKVDLLQLATLFVKYFPKSHVEACWKSIVKFSYENCIVDDITTNQCAFVLISHLMNKIGLPAKVVQQVYIAFLKDCKKDSKSLVLPALDMIIQPVKDAQLPSNDSKFPTWIRVTKKTLLEDSPSAIQLLNIWTIFIRHADSFYESREFFMSKMINSLSKIGYSSMNLENKKLYIQLVDLIISWEERAAGVYHPEDDNDKKRKVEQLEQQDTNGSKKRKVDEASSVQSNNGPVDVDTFRLKPQSRSIVLNYLLRMCVFVSSFQPRTEKPQILYKECISILKRALNLWKEETISFSQIEKQFPNSEEGSSTLNPTSLCCILELMTLFVELNRGIIQLNAQFAKKLIPFLANSNIDVNKNACKFFKTLLQHFDPLVSKDTDVQEFYSVIWSSIKETIGKYAGKENTNQVDNLSHIYTVVVGSFGHLLLLHILCDHYQNEETKQQFFKQVYGLLNKILKQVGQVEWKDLLVGFVELCLSFLVDGHDPVGKHFLSAIIFLVEKPDILNIFSPNLLHLIIDIVFHLVKPNPSNTIVRSYTLPLGDDLKMTKLGKRAYKVPDLQKVGLLIKLVTLFEQAPDELNDLKRIYFTLLMEVYQQMDDTNSPISKRIEFCFMSGLKIESKDLKDIKTKYLSILNRKVEKTAFKRLQFVIESSRWEPLSDRFWIKYALELLLESINGEEKLNCDKNTAKISPISIDFGKRDGTILRGYERISYALTQHETFVNTIPNLKSIDMINPLKVLIRASTNMSFKAWGAFFAIAWNQLNMEEKSIIQGQLQKLLSVEYHSKQYVKYPNVIQALLLGVNNVVLCGKSEAPFLSIHPETLKFIGKSFNAWSLTIPLLEEELRGMLNVGIFDEKTEKVCNSLAELYRVLKEDDILAGISRSCDITDQTKLVLSLEQRNNWNEAQEALKELTNAYHRGQIKKKVTHTELQLWEEHWLSCSKKLQQWDELTKYSQASSNATSLLSLECMWKNGNWQQMKELFQKHASMENQLLKFFQISCLIMQDKEVEAGETYIVAQQLALQRWCALPSFMCGNHTFMLHIFQQLYELNESATLLTDTKKPISTNELKGFLTTWRDRLPNKWEDIGIWNDIFTWRCHILKKAIERFDQKEEFAHHRALLLNETIWSLHKFSKISRKQNFIEPALRMLSETGKLLPTLTSETSEVFVRIIEIIKSLIKDRRYNDVLDYIESDTIATTKLKTTQKMEILRLRGEVYSICGRYDESYQTYAQSVSYFPQEPKYTSSITTTPSWGKSFFKWALVLDKLFVEKWNSPNRHQRTKQNSTKHPTLSMTALEFAENCIAAYLLAIKYSGGATNHQSIQASGATVRQYIGRVLWLLSFDEALPTEKSKATQEAVYPLQKVAEKTIGDIPAWMWIPWHQQLFSMLHRRDCEANIAKQLLKAILLNFPQSSFHTFRSFVHDLRELLSSITKKVSTKSDTGDATAPATLRSNNSNIHVSIKTSAESSQNHNQFYHDFFKKVRSRLDEIMQEGNKQLFNDLESMYKELTKYKSEPEEELAKSFELMLEIAFGFNIYSNQDAMILDDETHFIPPILIEYSKRIIECYFGDIIQPGTVPQQPQPQQAKTSFLSEYQSEIVADILPRKERLEYAKTLKYVAKTITNLGPRTIIELVNNLKKWIGVIQKKKINLIPTIIGIETQKAKLMEHKSYPDIEIPGQYELTSDREPFAERHERILCLLPSISMKNKKNRETGRSISLRSVSGKIFKFFIQSTSSVDDTTLKTEEKMASLIRHINRLLDKDKTAKSHNNVHLEYPIIITANQRIRFIREDYDYISLDEIYHDYCESMAKSIDTPILKYWQEMNKACSEHQNELETKLNVFNTILESRGNDDLSLKIPDTIMLNYFRGICPSWSEFYKIRKTFGGQLGIYNVLNYLLHTKDRQPYKILIAKNSGNLFQFDLRPNIQKSTGLIVRDDPTPFRLTRNMIQFLSQFGVEGYLLNSMSSVACSLSDNKDVFESLIQLFIRDELISYHNFNVDLLNNESSTPMGENRFCFNDDLVKGCVQQNLDSIMGLVAEMAPPIPQNLTCNPPQVLPAKKKSKKESVSSDTIDNISAASPSVTTPSTPSSFISTPTISASSQPVSNILDLPPLNSKVYELIQQASQPERLCLKDPSYYAWF